MGAQSPPMPEPTIATGNDGGSDAHAPTPVLLPFPLPDAAPAAAPADTLQALGSLALSTAAPLLPRSRAPSSPLPLLLLPLLMLILPPPPPLLLPLPLVSVWLLVRALLALEEGPSEVEGLPCRAATADGKPGAIGAYTVLSTCVGQG